MDERQFLNEDFISNCRSPTVNHKFDNAMREFLSQSDKMVFECVNST